MRKEAIVVMSQIEETSEPCLLEMYAGQEGSYLQGFSSSDGYVKKYVTHNHLYIISNNIVKKGDKLIKGAWYINTYRGFGMPFKNINLDNNGYLQQVLATTDPKLINKQASGEQYPEWVYDYDILEIPQSFIKEYCDKGGIYKIMVEYKIKQHGDMSVPGIIETINLKTNSDNIIIIYPFKNIWSKEEVEKLCKSAYEDGFYNGTLKDSPIKDPIFWIKENL